MGLDLGFDSYLTAYSSQTSTLPKAYGDFGDTVSSVHLTFSDFGEPTDSETLANALLYHVDMEAGMIETFAS